MRRFLFWVLFLFLSTPGIAGPNLLAGLAAPECDGTWIRPVQGRPAIPMWGLVDGIRVGLFPLNGPRGLIRIYTPYLGRSATDVMNFIAIEPIPAGSLTRGYSELEPSRLDQANGKRFWSTDDSLAMHPGDIRFPARGVISGEKGHQVMTFFIFSEAFDNGAKVYVRLRIREDHPYQVELSTFSYEGSVPLAHCIVTATMGNHARLRELHLKDTIKRAGSLWPDYKGKDFTLHDFTPLEEMIHNDKGTAYFIAAPDEKYPVDAAYVPRTPIHWRYTGIRATQYWYREEPSPDLKGLVNGRYCYWGCKLPIPGGVSYENFEIIEPFEEGATFVFGITPLSPECFIKQINGL